VHALEPGSLVDVGTLVLGVQAVHSVIPVRGAYLPAAHWSHVKEAGNTLNDPIAHGMHGLEKFNALPSGYAWVPAGQGEHTPLPSKYCALHVYVVAPTGAVANAGADSQVDAPTWAE
jgi:hypothetical protein